MIAFLVYVVYTDPRHAADIVREGWDIVWTAVNRLISFFNRLSTNG